MLDTLLQQEVPVTCDATLVASDVDVRDKDLLLLHFHFRTYGNNLLLTWKQRSSSFTLAF